MMNVLGDKSKVQSDYKSVYAQTAIYQGGHDHDMKTKDTGYDCIQRTSSSHQK